MAGDQASIYVWTGGTTTVTLPLANTLGSNWFFLFKNNGTGTVDIACTGSDLIDSGSLAVGIGFISGTIQAV